MLQILLPLAFALSVLGFNINADNVAVYWGQNSQGSQTRLRNYCTSDVDIVLLSFLYQFPNNLQLNFANMCSDTFSDGLLKCDDIAADIEYCQQQGKIVLLSMGGASGAYGFTSDSQATAFSQTLWNKFGGGSDNERPFGNAVVDGFDFDIETNNQVGYSALATGLRKQFAKDTSKKYYLSAAPQCPYPDASVGQLLENVPIDFAFIQFYNNYCALGSNFNWDTWQDYATNTSPNKNIKLFLGQPGGRTGAGSGYNSASVVKTFVNEIKLTPNFGGIMLWDASQATSNVENGVTYLHEMKQILNGSGPAVAAAANAAAPADNDASSNSVPVATQVVTHVADPTSVSTVKYVGTTTLVTVQYTQAPNA